MQFVRAPDENVYIAPFNLVEIVISGLLEWWVPKSTYEFINDCVMATLYSPLLFVAAIFERRSARKIRHNRSRGEEDDDQINEWEQFYEDLDMEGEGWTKTCEAVKPNVEDEPAVIEVRKLRAEMEELKAILSQLTNSKGSDDETITGSKSGKDPAIEDDDTQEIPEAAETQEAPDTSDTPEGEGASGDQKQGKKNKKKNKKKGPGGPSN